MLVLHACGTPTGGGRLWAEDSEAPVESSIQALRSARPHPFAAPAEVITAIHPGKPGSVVLWLPSLRSAPLDSPELIRITARPAARTAPTLLAWTVPVVHLDTAAVLDLLDAPTPRSAMAQLAFFARQLVERGRVLPAVRRDDHGALGCWRPVLRGRDVVTLTALSAAMPPVYRADNTGVGPHELALSMLDAMVDAAVRTALAGPDLSPPRRGRRPKRLPAAEAWLAALAAPDGRFDADADEIDFLAKELAAMGGDRHRRRRPGDRDVPALRGRVRRRRPGRLTVAGGVSAAVHR